MRKALVFILTAALLLGAGSALAQPQGDVKTGQTSQTTTPMGGQDMSQLMQQLQDSMQQLQAKMSKEKLTAVDLKKMQDMLNQMQGMMNQMQITGMAQMMQNCPMMKQMQQGTQSQSTPGTAKPEEKK